MKSFFSEKPTKKARPSIVVLSVDGRSQCFPVHVTFDGGSGKNLGQDRNISQCLLGRTVIDILPEWQNTLNTLLVICSYVN